MDLDQIIKLIDAGYSKEEIAAMAKPAGAEPKEPVGGKPKEPAGNEPKEPAGNEPKEQAKEPANPGSIDATIAKLDSLSAKLDKYAESMAKLAIMNTQQPPKQDINDFLASIINPHYNEEVK